VSTQKNLKRQKVRRTYRVRNKFVSRGKMPRVSVYRSLKQIYVQIIDDATHSTLASYSSKLVSSKLVSAKGDKTAIAKQVGLELAKLAKEKSVENVFFDRGSYRYHGRVHALAEGLREGGLKF